MRRRPPIALLAVAGLVVVAVGAFTLLSVESRPTVVPVNSSDCAPPPCGAPAGFEVDVANVVVTGGLLKMDVQFRNHTTPGLEAISYRHTAPIDFHLALPDGSSVSPLFSQAGCSEWAAVQVERGGMSEIRPLCFQAGNTPLSDLLLVWDPDLGLIPQPVAIRLAR
jgi:hypothetical protein